MRFSITARGSKNSILADVTNQSDLARKHHDHTVAEASDDPSEKARRERQRDIHMNTVRGVQAAVVDYLQTLPDDGKEITVSVNVAVVHGGAL